MSKEQFNDDCEGCRPAIIDVQTGKPAAPDSMIMQAVNRVWSATTLDERRAFHRVCCLNSRAPEDLLIMQSLSLRIQDAANSATN